MSTDILLEQDQVVIVGGKLDARGNLNVEGVTTLRGALQVERATLGAGAVRIARRTRDGNFTVQIRGDLFFVSPSSRFLGPVQCRSSLKASEVQAGSMESFSLVINAKSSEEGESDDSDPMVPPVISDDFDPELDIDDGPNPGDTPFFGPGGRPPFGPFPRPGGRPGPRPGNQPAQPPEPEQPSRPGINPSMLMSQSDSQAMLNAEEVHGRLVMQDVNGDRTLVVDAQSGDIVFRTIGSLLAKIAELESRLATLED